jgi:hypothetical protein
LDPIKIVIFLAVFAILLLIGRRLASSSEVHASQLPRPATDAREGSAAEDSPQQALTGAELDFPVQVPPVTPLGDGRYNRPNVLNYYFAKIDLVSGPDDPSSFCDEFYIKFQDPESEHVWTDDYTVATPTGLQRVMSSEKFDSLYLAGNVVLVARWDLRLILQTVMEETMKVYSSAEPASGKKIAFPDASKVTKWGSIDSGG